MKGDAMVFYHHGAAIQPSVTRLGNTFLARVSILEEDGEATSLGEFANRDCAYEFAVRSATAFIDGEPLPRSPFQQLPARWNGLRPLRSACASGAQRHVVPHTVEATPEARKWWTPAVLFLAFDPGQPSIVDAAASAQEKNGKLFIRGALTNADRAGNFVIDRCGRTRLPCRVA
jgi:hypothetical protein